MKDWDQLTEAEKLKAMGSDSYTNVVQLSDARREKAVDWRLRVSLSKQGVPHAHVSNAILMLLHDDRWRGVLQFDRFSSEVQTVRQPPFDADDREDGWQPGPWTTTDGIRCASYLARHHGLRVGMDTVHAAVEVVARKTQVHPILDYFNTLTHDGTPRVRKLLSAYFGAAANAYTEAVSVILMVGAVARVEQPGAKLDTLLCLEGKQGIGKSTAVRRLVGDAWFSDTPLDLSSKDRFTALRGRWGIEIPELDGFDRHETTRIKAFISSPVDTYREPYARADARFPRQCFFVATTNSFDYLRDVTGNRRFLPVRCAGVDVDAIVRDRDQLWAEARALYHEGVEWWPSAELTPTFEAEQSQRVVADAWEEPVASYVESRAFVTMGDVLSFGVGIEIEKQTTNDQTRVARILAKLGRERKQRRIAGKQTWGYVVTSQPELVVT